jgi:hypothetical protein
MNRRNFLSLFSAGVAGIALEQAIPLGRVWSFPKEIVIPNFQWDDYSAQNFLRSTAPGMFDIGDVISLPAFGPELYVVSHVSEEGDVHILPQLTKTGGGIVAAHARRAIQRYNFTAAFPPDNSHTPS